MMQRERELVGDAAIYPKLAVSPGPSPLSHCCQTQIPCKKEPVQWGWVGEDAGPGSCVKLVGDDRDQKYPALQGTLSAVRRTRVCRTFC